MFDTERDAVAAFAVLAQPSVTAAGSSGGAALDREHALRDRLSTVQALRGVLAAVEAETMVGLHQVAGGTSADLGHELPRPDDRAALPSERRWCRDLLVSLQDEVALATDVSPRTAACWLNRSHDLLDRFPALHQAMRSGRVPAHAAWQIVSVLRHLSQRDSDDAVVEALLAWGARYGWSRIRSKAREFALRAEPVIADAWHEDGVESRHVAMVPLPDGMAQLEVVAPAVDIAAAFSAVANTAACLIREGDPRTADQLRCDLTLRRMAGLSDDESEPGVAPTVVIHATAADIRALTDPITGASAAAQLTGYGPLPQGAFLEALRSARLRYRLTDRVPVGPSERHDPSTALATHVRDRDRTCRFPGCTRSAERADLDHRVEFGQPGGSTTAQNLHVLCRAHHRLKHHGGWRIEPDSDGGQTWIDPAGQHHRSPPPDADLTGHGAPPETQLFDGTPGPDDLPDFAADVGWAYRLAV